MPERPDLFSFVAAETRKKSRGAKIVINLV